MPPTRSESLSGIALVSQALHTGGMVGKWWVSVALMAACFACGGAPGPNRFTIDVWDTDSGLPQNSVISMFRTRDGYLWLGTVNGLVRFDGVGRRMSGGVGVQFPIFDERNTPALKSSLIIKVFEDSQRNLWIGTETEGIVRVRDGEFESVMLGGGGLDGRLMSVCEDKSGAVWLYSAGGHLGRYAKGKLESWRFGSDLPSRARQVIVDESNVLWVGTDRGLVGWDATNAPSGAPRYQLPVLNLAHLLPSKSGGYWRLANGRIQKWVGDRRERDLGAYPWDPRSTLVYTACEDAAGNLVVGTGGDGVYWFDAQGGFLQLSLTNGLSNSTVLSLLADREGNLWVGTDGGGLNRVRQQTFAVVEASRGLVVRSVCEDPQGGVWIGYSMPGYNIARIDRIHEGTVTSYSNTHGLFDLQVRSVFAESSGQVWAGTLGKGLLKFSDGLFLQAREAGNFREVVAMYEDRAGHLWAGTSEGLACRTGKGWQLVTTQDGLGGNSIRAIAEDDQGVMWVGTDRGGVSRVTGGNEKVFEQDGAREGRAKEKAHPSHRGPPPEGEGGLQGLSISCLLWGTNETLWAGTSRGLARYAHGAWAFYTNHAGLSLANIGYLIEDEEGFLWMGSNMGLMRTPRSALEAFARGATNEIPIRYYGKADGLPTRECSSGSQPAAFRSADGTLWFSTIKGLASVNPKFIVRNTNPPPVIIEAVAVEGQIVTSQGLRTRVPESLEIPAGRENLDVYFTSLNLSAPDQGQFRYHLDGYERVPTTVPGNIRTAHYSRLPHGSYTFRITACNEDGVWNEVGASLAITVLPPFWKTWWFIAGTVLLILASVAGSVHYVSTQRLQRQVSALRQQEALERERARIARDLHDQLGANLTQVALLGELAETDKEEPREVESHARQICQTARETTRALDEIVWTVNPSNDTLEGLGNYICKYAQDYLETADVRCRLDVPSQLPSTPISPELRHNVFLVAKEAINNLVKHSEASEARVKLAVEEDRFRLEIQDDGKGLPPGSEDKGRNGLKNMRRRMTELGGTFDLNSNAGQGTTVRISAPLKPHYEA